ncbi:hypothetical protein RUM43_004613 [Polyplax serrata]|uniref:Uncharacterized protein n=1 Tax=Polyplax serrata TaxID=468196 RepID=A0AAN8SB13_POLSC
MWHGKSVVRYVPGNSRNHLREQKSCEQTTDTFERLPLAYIFGVLLIIVAIKDIVCLIQSNSRCGADSNVWRNRINRGSQSLGTGSIDHLIISLLTSCEFNSPMNYDERDDVTETKHDLRLLCDSLKQVYLTFSVTPAAERDLKLMVSILSAEHYLLMIFGVLQKNPALFMPWLMMEAIIVALEAIFFGMRLFAEGLSIKRTEVLMSREHSPKTIFHKVLLLD